MFATVFSATGNVVSGNVTTIGQISAVGNVRGGNVLTTGYVSAFGNITGGNILGNGRLLTGINTIANGNSNVLVGTSGGNISVNVNGISPIAVFTPLGETITGSLSVTGNITGSYFLGNGSQLTGIVTGRSLTVGTRTAPVTIPLTAAGTFTVSTRNSGNVVINVTT